MATDVSTSLPQLDLAPLTTITVTIDDANAVITRLNVYGYTPERDEASAQVSFVPAYVYGIPP